MKRHCSRRAARTSAVQAKCFKESLQGQEGNHNASLDKFEFKLKFGGVFSPRFYFKVKCEKLNFYYVAQIVGAKFTCWFTKQQQNRTDKVLPPG